MPSRRARERGFDDGHARIPFVTRTGHGDDQASLQQYDPTFDVMRVRLWMRSPAGDIVGSR